MGRDLSNEMIGAACPRRGDRCRAPRPSILDQLSIRYVRGPLEKPPGLQDDPGRFRNTAFFDKMYGDCSKGEVQRKLKKIAWLPSSGGGVGGETPNVPNPLRSPRVRATPLFAGASCAANIALTRDADSPTLHSPPDSNKSRSVVSCWAGDCASCPVRHFLSVTTF
jgi:hypothetical protein